MSGMGGHPKSGMGGTVVWAVRGNPGMGSGMGVGRNWPIRVLLNEAEVMMFAPPLQPYYVIYANTNLKGSM